VKREVKRGEEKSRKEKRREEKRREERSGELMTVTLQYTTNSTHLSYNTRPI
jgi:hypothetical protein